MMTQTDYTRLLNLLDKAEKLSSEYQGGYSGQFLSAEEFSQALSDSINKLKQGDKTQLEKLHVWFLPTSCWDDFVRGRRRKFSRRNQRPFINIDKEVIFPTTFPGRDVVLIVLACFVSSPE